ncbi:MAG: FecR domain-containing protein, partial [Proteobacteria bacterium]|nr:FecR domain-containing protein [Pseudomonadota bacterium]
MKKYCLKLIVFGGILLFLTSVSFAEEAAVLISSKGSVLISENGQDDWIKAVSGISIQEGWYVKVGKNSEAALMLKDRSQIRLRDNSTICLKESGSAPGEKKQKKGLLRFFKGEFWMRNKRKVIKPDIHTASLNMSIRGTELRVMISPDGETRVTALEGEILCENESGSTIIARGLEAVARKGEAIETHKLINPDNSVQWLLVTLNVVGPRDEFPTTSKAIRAVELSRDSMNLLSENQMEKAHEKALEAINTSPDTASANIAMATILQVQGKLEDAFTFARKGSQIDPDSEPALFRNIELLLGLNRTKDAEHLWNSFKAKRTSISYMLKGYIHLLKQESFMAEQTFHTAISMEKEISRAWVGLGLAMYAQGKIDQGLDKLEIASLLNPLSAFPHNNLGKALYEAKEYKEAENEFIRASLLDPNDPTPYLYLAIMAQDNFEPVKSIKQLKKALEMNDNRFVSRSRFLLDMDRSVKNINLAAAMSALGLNEWGRHIGNKAVWQDNSNSSAYTFRASEALSLQRVDVSTLSDLKRAELLKPVNSNTFPSFTDYYSL